MEFTLTYSIYSSFERFSEISHFTMFQSSQTKYMYMNGLREVGKGSWKDREVGKF